MQQQSHPKTLLRVAEASAFTGNKRSTFYDKITDGLIPVPVGIGGEQKAWPLHELEQINDARIRGRSDDEIRALVVKLESERGGAPAAPRRKPQKRSSVGLAAAA